MEKGKKSKGGKMMFVFSRQFPRICWCLYLNDPIQCLFQGDPPTHQGIRGENMG